MKSGNLSIKSPITIQKIVSLLLLVGISLLLVFLISISFSPSVGTFLIILVFVTIYLVATWYLLYIYKIIQPFFDEISIRDNLLCYKRIELLFKFTKIIVDLHDVKEVIYSFQSHYVSDTNEPDTLVFTHKDKSKPHELVNVKDWKNEQIDKLLSYLKKQYNIVIKNKSNLNPLENFPRPLQPVY